MRGKKICRIMGWVFTISGILKTFTHLNLPILITGSDFLWLGFAFFLLGRIKISPNNNKDLQTSTEDKIKLDNKRENLSKDFIIRFIAITVLYFGFGLLKHLPWQIVLGIWLGMVALGAGIYGYQFLDQNIIKPVLKLFFCVVVFSFGIYVAGLSYKSLNTPSEMWDHDTESKLFTFFLFVSLIALAFGIKSVWQLIQNRRLHKKI